MKGTSHRSDVFERGALEAPLVDRPARLAFEIDDHDLVNARGLLDFGLPVMQAVAADPQAAAALDA